MKDKQIYEKLREFRRARGISVGQLAKELGENSQKVGRIERGKRSLTVDYLLKVSKAFSKPIETIFEEKKLSSASGVFDSNLLNDVVLLIEEIAPKLQYTSQQKGKVISQIYESILKLPQENQRLFLNLLRKSLNTLLFSCN